MPRSAKFTRDEIVEAAYRLVRTQGEEALSARHLARELGCSTAPLFAAFDSIEDIFAEVKARAWERYTAYVSCGLRSELPFKGAGLGYIRFAKEEPQLFRLFFMKGGVEATHYMPAADPTEPLVRGALESSHGLSTERARRIYNHMSVYVHGLASLFAMGNATFTEEDVERMLTELFGALKATLGT